MSISQLKKFLTTAAKAANDRIRTLNKPENISGAQAYRHIVEPLTGASYIKQRPDKKTGIMLTVFTQPKAPKSSAGIGANLEYQRNLREAVYQVKKFLASKTSTVAGIREVAEKRRQSLDRLIDEQRAARGDRSRKGSGLSNEDKDKILRWMGSAEGRAAMERADSNQVRDAITQSVRANRASGGNASIEDLYQEFEASEETFADWIAASEETLSILAVL